ncbi:MAG: hypothetical protein GY762_02865 [Proteobacteria bacterium]|nr:hypothetical protein [Pseudomonadota bacterium]
MAEREKQLLITGVLLVMAVISIAGLFDVGRQYLDFGLVYGKGITNITASELVFYLWYFTFGVLAICFLSAALMRMSFLQKFEIELERFIEWRFFVPSLALLLFGEIILFQYAILDYAPVTDDESVYVFIAKTLLKGRLVNPSPGDLEFFQNQFIIVNNDMWYGKYPIGHPLFLAVGELLALRFLVVPLVTTLTFVMTYIVGVELFTKKQAGLALCLLVISPHFIFMGASELSHPTASLLMMLGLWSLLKIRKEGNLLWGCMSGVFWGYGLLVRPFPGILFALAAGVWLILGAGELTKKRKLLTLLLGLLPVLLAGLFLLWVNDVQTGSPMRTGYHASENISAGGLRSLGLFANYAGIVGTSVGGALVRQNFWLFGWPLSLIFIPFARPRTRRIAFWGLIAAAYVYRLVIPKTVVSTLGPVYMTEIVPLLALASANGMVRLRNKFLWSEAPTKQLIPAVVMAACVVAAVTFVPIQMREIRISSAIRQTASRLVERNTQGEVLVFANKMVYPPYGHSWSVFPPNPSPDLDDRVIFVRQMVDDEGAERNMDFWQRRFPDRSAWLFHAGSKGGVFREIKSARDFVLSPVVR